MFAENNDGTGARGRRRRGRPLGPTAQGESTRRQLYETAIRAIASRGYEATTLRAIAKEAGVSAGLLYRYFPSKRAVVLALYDELSVDYASRASDEMEPGTWATRALLALRTSLNVIAPARDTLAALTPVLIGDASDGLFAPSTSSSRQRVQAVYEQAVTGGSDAPAPGDAAALARLLYVVHLTVIMWWLLDKSRGQRTTAALLTMLERLMPMGASMLRRGPTRALLRRADALCREGLFGDAPER